MHQHPMSTQAPYPDYLAPTISRRDASQARHLALPVREFPAAEGSHLRHSGSSAQSPSDAPYEYRRGHAVSWPAPHPHHFRGHQHPASYEAPAYPHSDPIPYPAAPQQYYSYSPPAPQPYQHQPILALGPPSGRQPGDWDAPSGVDWYRRTREASPDGLPPAVKAYSSDEESTAPASQVPCEKKRLRRRKAHELPRDHAQRRFACNACAKMFAR